PAPSGERARGADGRFLPGGAEAPPPRAPKPPAAPAAATPTNGTKPPPGAPGAAAKPPAEPPAGPQLRAPTSWKPGAREHWGKLPTEVQAEVVRRENEVGRTMQESANARNALSHVQNVLAPYAANIAATGADALTCMQHLFQADNTL